MSLSQLMPSGSESSGRLTPKFPANDPQKMEKVEGNTETKQ